MYFKNIYIYIYRFISLKKALHDFQKRLLWKQDYIFVLNFVPHVYCILLISLHQILMIQWNMGFSKTGFVSFAIGSSSAEPWFWKQWIHSTNKRVTNSLNQQKVVQDQQVKSLKILHREANFPPRNKEKKIFPNILENKGGVPLPVFDKIHQVTPPQRRVEFVPIDVPEYLRKNPSSNEVAEPWPVPCFW